jgi:hypothetical protein
VRYINRGRFESFQYYDKKYYKKTININECLGIHCKGVKPAEQLMFRDYYCDWNEYIKLGGSMNFKNYILNKEGAAKKPEKLLSIAIKNMSSFCRKYLKKYDEKLCPYPDIIKNKINNCRFEVLYENDKIIGWKDRKQSSKLILIK